MFTFLSLSSKILETSLKVFAGITAFIMFFVLRYSDFKVPRPELLSRIGFRN